MNERIEIKNIGEGVEEVFISALHVHEGDNVKKGDLIADVETYKTVFQVESEYDGVVMKVYVVSGQSSRLPVIICDIQTSSDRSIVCGQSESKRMVSPRAKRLMKQAGIDEEEIFNLYAKPTIEEKDVKDYISKHGSARVRQTTGGLVNDEFYRYLTDDFENDRVFFRLSSEEKIDRLKKAGAVIGNRVVLKHGAGVIGRQVVIEDNVEIGRNTVLKGKNVNIGKYVIFENDCFWQCRKMCIGKYSYISSESRVGWGGEWENHASLRIGDRSHIGEQAVLNPSREIKIGDDVSVGAGTKIYTHQFWQSILDGYVALHEPVEIKSYVQIGANAVLLPGTVVGSGITVSANSLLSGQYKGPGLVGGNPARVLQKGLFPYNLSPEDKKTKIVHLLEVFADNYTLECQREGDRRVTVTGKNIEIFFDNDGRIAKEDKYSILVTFDTVSKNAFDVIFDLSRKIIQGSQNDYSDVLREHFRKYGVIFRGDWKYRYKAISL